ncbi:MAG: hypothetical protein K2Q01_11895, partial [Rickettsiales bacterium]|nr:hypothetical protein [Rickettsiales bacterium]
TRIDGNWQDRVDVPLHEVAEAYEVDVMDGSAVKRTLTGLSVPQASYTAAMQVVDFGAVQSSVSVRVYQVSGYVGRGYAGVAVV